jgi:hypothetical protein
MRKIDLLKKMIKEKEQSTKADTAMFQCWVDDGLLDRVRLKKALDRVSWRDLLESMFKLYVGEAK